MEATVQPEEEKKESKSILTKYVNPVVGYGVFGGALALAIGIALIVLLPLL